MPRGVSGGRSLQLQRVAEGWGQRGLGRRYHWEGTLGLEVEGVSGHTQGKGRENVGLTGDSGFREVLGLSSSGLGGEEWGRVQARAEMGPVEILCCPVRSSLTLYTIGGEGLLPTSAIPLPWHGLQLTASQGQQAHLLASDPQTVGVSQAPGKPSSTHHCALGNLEPQKWWEIPWVVCLPFFFSCLGRVVGPRMGGQEA